MTMFSGSSGVKCIVTVNPSKAVKETALCCHNNPLGLATGDYCWLQLFEGKRYFRVSTHTCVSVQGLTPIEVHGALNAGFETHYGSAGS